MKELDSVKLLSEYNNIPKGTEGCIVCENDKKFFDVEFFDNDGNTIDVVLVPVEYLKLTWEYKNKD